jgi:signal transduction histidine kinase
MPCVELDLKDTRFGGGHMGHHPWQRRLLLALIGLFAVTLIGGTLISSFQWISKPFPGFFLHENRTVAPFFLPGWSGAVGGLEALDLIVAVEGRSLVRRGDLYDTVRGAPAGTLFHYRVMRNGATLELRIPSVTLRFQDWFFSFGVYLGMGVAFLIIGAAPYYLRASSPVALPLCFMVIAVFVWFETTFDFVTRGFLPKELRIFGLALTPGAGVHLALLLRSGTPLWRSKPAALVLIYAISIFLGWLNSATFFGPPEIWIVAFRANYVYACAGALAFLAIVGSALSENLPSLERSRLRVMFGGAVLGFLLPTFGTVLTSSFQWAIPYNFALIPTVFFPLSVAYALLKYSLFDLDNAFKVALTRVALTALLLLIYAMVLFVGSVFGIYDNDPLVPLVFSVLVVLVFNPLLRWIEAAVDRYVYRQEYDPRQVQGELSLLLRSLNSSPNIVNEFRQRLSKHLGIETATVAYLAKGTKDYLVASTPGIDQTMDVVERGVRALSEEPLATFYHGVSRGEATTDPRFRRHREALLGVFEPLRAELLIPLVFEREVRGFVSFGDKRLRKEYSTEDLRLLATLSEQLALSLENARLYDESVKAYKEAEATNKRLLEMDRAKKQFVANICHELRTPVSTIIGYSEVLLDPHFSGNRRDILERLVQNGGELSSLMDNLLNFSRLEADAAFTQFEAVKLKEILDALQMMTRRLIRERPIEFQLNLEAPIDTIQSDGQKLQQILVHLLTNAVKFTEKGKIELSVRTVPDKEGDAVEIAVADTGIGIDERDQEIIFDDFRQLDGSSTRHYGGTGLGLSLCRKLACALGGTISVSSEKGMGSVFSLLLPLVPAPARVSGVAEVAYG